MDYTRFDVGQAKGRFQVLDLKTGWVWDEIQNYSTVLYIMQHILSNKLEFADEEYKRIRKLDGDEWEREIHAGTVDGSSEGVRRDNHGDLA